MHRLSLQTTGHVSSDLHPSRLGSTAARKAIWATNSRYKKNAFSLMLVSFPTVSQHSSIAYQLKFSIIMSQPLILALPNWVEQRITDIYKAKNADDFNTAFDAFVSHHVHIKVNGKPMSREQYKTLIMGEIKNDDGADISFNGIVTVLDNTESFRPTLVCCCI